ncbi:MAG: hypothetical protein K2G69_09665 [Muribaculaceae bacterium]|nr:hypothetical protein [Muribaculaceae bacterium]
MAKNSMTSSERRGIIVVALLALIIIGSGMIVARCGGSEPQPDNDEVYTLLADSLQQEINTAREKSHRDSLKRHRSDSIKRKKKGKSQKSPKTYRKRQPLDEPVSR